MFPLGMHYTTVTSRFRPDQSSLMSNNVIRCVPIPILEMLNGLGLCGPLICPICFITDRASFPACIIPMTVPNNLGYAPLSFNARCTPVKPVRVLVTNFVVTVGLARCLYIWEAISGRQVLSHCAVPLKNIGLADDAPNPCIQM